MPKIEIFSRNFIKPRVIGSTFFQSFWKFIYENVLCYFEYKLLPYNACIIYFYYKILNYIDNDASVN